jgi:hypothetical protein
LIRPTAPIAHGIGAGFAARAGGARLLSSRLYILTALVRAGQHRGSGGQVTKFTRFMTIDDILAEIEAVYDTARTSKMDWKNAESAARILTALARLRLDIERRRGGKTADVAAPIVFYGSKPGDYERAKAQARREAAARGAEAYFLLPEKKRLEAA